MNYIVLQCTLFRTNNWSQWIIGMHACIQPLYGSLMFLSTTKTFAFSSSVLVGSRNVFDHNLISRKASITIRLK